MKPRHELTPAQLVLVALLGFIIAAAAVPLTRFARSTGACDCIRWIPVLLILCVFLIGMVVTLYASSLLKKGIASRRWPEEQLEPLRSLLESWFFSALPFVLLAAYGVLWLIFPKYRLIGLSCFLLMQVISQLRAAVRRPLAKPSNLPAGWRDYLAPIHSDQWGQR